MSSATRFTTTRVRNRLRRPSAISPSTRSPASAARHPRRRRLGLDLRRLLALRIEDGLDPLALAALDHAAILGEVHRDPLAGHHIVVLPHPRISEEDHALLGVIVLGPPRRADL